MAGSTGSFLQGILNKVANGAGQSPGPMTPQDTAAARIARLGMTPRQQELNELWTRYMCGQYENRKLDWDGSEHPDPVGREMIAQQAVMPPGFIDKGGQLIPVKFRRPSAPYHMTKVIVNRFTGLLFSDRRHPQLNVQGDEETEAFVRALAEQGALWSEMAAARGYGGSTGTCCIGFKFIDGKIQFDAFDIRWCNPEFKNRDTFEMKWLEIRYQFPKERRDETGTWRIEPWWYRRIITETRDTLYKECPVGDGEEPKWAIETEVEHDLGFCPVVWIQNEKLKGTIDGIPDCHGTFDMQFAIDALLSQGVKGILATEDPTAVVSTDATMAEVNLGSNNVLKLPKDGNGKFLEISGVGFEVAMKWILQLRDMVLEQAQCVLEDTDKQAKTATEVSARKSAMYERADKMREQYGKGIASLMEMAVKAAKKITTTPKTIKDENGEEHSATGSLVLPKRQKKDQNGKIAEADHVIGPGGVLSLKWPPYEYPNTQDTLLSTQAASTAKESGLIDAEHASKHVAPNFGVEDVGAMMEKIKTEAKQRQNEGDQAMMESMRSSMRTQ
jgi:hypothetical protein